MTARVPSVADEYLHRISRAPNVRGARKEWPLPRATPENPDPLRLKVLVDDREAIEAVQALTALAKKSPKLVKRFVRSCGGVSKLVLMKSPPAPRAYNCHVIFYPCRRLVKFLAIHGACDE